MAWVGMYFALKSRALMQRFAGLSRALIEVATCSERENPSPNLTSTGRPFTDTFTVVPKLYVVALVLPQKLQRLHTCAFTMQPSPPFPARRAASSQPTKSILA